MRRAPGLRVPSSAQWGELDPAQSESPGRPTGAAFVVPGPEPAPAPPVRAGAGGGLATIWPEMRRWRGPSPQPLSNKGIVLVPVGFFAIVRAWLRLIIVGAVVGALVSLVVSLVTPATYVGRVTLIVTPISSTGGITFSDVEVTQALAPTFARVVGLAVEPASLHCALRIPRSR